jgi:hypothetical protein
VATEQEFVDRDQIRQRFLIVCEGTKTEPNYFKKFRVPKIVIDIEGLGKDPHEIVREARRIKQQKQRRKDPYDQVWCVFDRDSWAKQRFNQAFQYAQRHGIKIAYSNEAFELWYILHFEFLRVGIHRSAYKRKLGTLLGHSYHKNSSSMYEELLDRQEVAIENAKQLLSLYHPPDPEKDNPSTTVHLLVEELNKNLPGRKDK